MENIFNNCSSREFSDDYEYDTFSYSDWGNGYIIQDNVKLIIHPDKNFRLEHYSRYMNSDIGDPESSCDIKSDLIYSGNFEVDNWQDSNNFDIKLNLVQSSDKLIGPTSTKDLDASLLCFIRNGKPKFEETNQLIRVEKFYLTKA